MTLFELEYFFTTPATVKIFSCRKIREIRKYKWRLIADSLSFFD